MARLRSNEWNFSSNAAARISEILRGEQFSKSPLGHAEAELTEFMGNHRLDIVIFDRTNDAKPLITGELKVPWDALGRTPHNSKVLQDAHAKASNCGATYFITWNIRRAVVWRTDDPGVPLPQRVIYDQELIPTVLTKATDLSKSEFLSTWKKAVEKFVTFLHQLMVGATPPTYLPLDRQFIGRLESLLDFPLEFTTVALAERLAKDAAFRRRAESWMRDRQGWLITPAAMPENIDRASRFTCYVLVNRLCFYNALRRKYPELQRLNIHNRINTGAALKARLSEAFDLAMRFTGDYDTVFELEVGDEFPFLSDEAVPDWRSLIRSLDGYDFATIDLEVIGAMYEQLISPEERHRYGQHYTQPAVVDLINAFSINSGRGFVLDPACGGGTFLVRAYSRKRHLDSAQDHTTLLASLYGCDLLRYACHLSVINLAIRDLIDDENYPRIHSGDFLDVRPSSVFARLPTRIASGGLPTGVRELNLTVGSCDAVVGNPPYIQSRQIPAVRRAAYLAQAHEEWPNYDWNKASDILVWFFTHSAIFLRPGGYLSLLTQAAWIDVEYGIPLQHWMLENFRIIAVLETEAEAWFSDARVATVVTVLARDDDANRRNNNLVRFVQFSKPLHRSQSGETESTRQEIAENMRDAILAYHHDAIDSRFRVRIVPQGELANLGTDVNGKYLGIRWGRYLRAIDVLYELQRDQSDKFCVLDDLAGVTRGVTTNRDDFFIVTDITQEALERIVAAGQFQTIFGVRRADVVGGRFKIVRRDDGVELPLDTDCLVPMLKTARDVGERCTSAVNNDVFAVYITGPRANLSRVAAAYVAAGEREHWHESESFNGRGDWYTLRDADIAPILFVKTIQYAPQVFWNDAGLLANQRLYNISPRNGVDAEVLGAVLNSTIFAAERFAGVKALGREAANDVEVYTARQFKVPDIRRFSPSEQRKLRDAFRRLRQSSIGPLLEPTLLDAGLNEARVYADQNPITESVWPVEMKSPHREQIDDVILRGLGLSEQDVTQTRIRLYNELIAFTRKAKLLELEAQINRRGRGGEGPAAAQLADDLWADLISNNQATIQTIPNDFLPPGIKTKKVTLPVGRVEMAAERDLFNNEHIYALQFGRGTIIEFDSSQQRDLALLLAMNRVRGDMQLPRAAAACDITAKAVHAYLEDLEPKLRLGAKEITENTDLQSRIINEAMKRLLPHHR